MRKEGELIRGLKRETERGNRSREGFMMITGVRKVERTMICLRSTMASDCLSFS